MTSNPDPLRSVGAALSNWSMVELQLANLFSAAADMRSQRNAYAHFDTIISFDTRLAICDRLMSLEEVDEIESTMWTVLSAKLSKSYKKRHELAHFSARHDDDGETCIGITPFNTWSKFAAGTDKILTILDIQERAKKFIDLHMAVGWFSVQAFSRHAGSPPQVQPEPALVPQLRALAIQRIEAKKRPGSQPQS
ncbi:hypothetical protein LGH82_31320 [Mesorhizobium sp. PAMC28654]|uniref:hypothetical protein n=1 Tax=Mesorhizobium sp. PAMC28654 TaxID=2880934 RepID=UPI001D0A8C3F|nr:hypothetical protein [Mesorhizobium sp. PAMC28654]UDL89492.1 hypothetical protein LGH82_31320 [Mesorhizobium sp. PAMC28654]